MKRFTSEQCRLLEGNRYDVVENDDESSFAYVAQLTKGDYWLARVTEAAGLNGFSSFYPHYFLRVNNHENHFAWYGAPKMANLNAKRAEFMGVFLVLNQDTLDALTDVIWKMERRPLPERRDFEIQRLPKLQLKH